MEKTNKQKGFTILFCLKEQVMKNVSWLKAPLIFIVEIRWAIASRKDGY